MSKTPKSYEDCATQMLESNAPLAGTLTHDETVRGSALSLACRYYTETIVKDGDLYREMVRDNKVLKPATYGGVIEVALSFEAFLRGEFTRQLDEAVMDNPSAPAPSKEL